MGGNPSAIALLGGDSDGLEGWRARRGRRKRLGRLGPSGATVSKYLPPGNMPGSPAGTRNEGGGGRGVLWEILAWKGGGPRRAFRVGANGALGVLESKLRGAAEIARVALRKRKYRSLPALGCARVFGVGKSVLCRGRARGRRACEQVSVCVCVLCVLCCVCVIARGSELGTSRQVTLSRLGAGRLKLAIPGRGCWRWDLR